MNQSIPFRFTEQNRSVVARLTDLLKDLNQADPGGHFSAISKAVDAIVDIDTGFTGMAERINGSRYGCNFGANESWLKDVEFAIENQLEEIYYEEWTCPACCGFGCSDADGEHECPACNGSGVRG